MVGPDKRELERLHARFLELTRDSADGSRLIVEEILMHSISQQKLRAAVGVVLKHNALHTDYRNDITQEATLDVISYFGNSKVPYDDHGPQAFANWLWKIWHRACLKAAYRFQKSQPPGTVNLITEDGLPVDETTLPEFQHQRDVWQQTLYLIARFRDPQMRVVMSDWAAGFSGLETSRRRGLSVWKVYRTKKKGFKLLRRLLQGEDLI